MAKIYFRDLTLRAYKQGDGTRWGITDQPSGKPLVGNDIANVPENPHKSAEQFATLFAAAPELFSIVDRFAYAFSDVDGLDRAMQHGLDGLLVEARAIIDQLS